jgi:hypothetical protein
MTFIPVRQLILAWIPAQPVPMYTDPLVAARADRHRGDLVRWR